LLNEQHSLLTTTFYFLLSMVSLGHHNYNVNHIDDNHHVHSWAQVLAWLARRWYLCLQWRVSSIHAVEPIVDRFHPWGLLWVIQMCCHYRTIPLPCTHRRPSCFPSSGKRYYSWRYDDCMVEGGGTSNTATLYYPNWYVDVEKDSGTVSVCS
jgi:hypothetical protein